jgi:hypothetical protein
MSKNTETLILINSMDMPKCRLLDLQKQLHEYYPLLSLELNTIICKLESFQNKVKLKIQRRIEK